jgi:hypothetical protein
MAILMIATFRCTAMYAFLCTLAHPKIGRRDPSMNIATNRTRCLLMKRMSDRTVTVTFPIARLSPGWTKEFHI